MSASVPTLTGLCERTDSGSCCVVGALIKECCNQRVSLHINGTGSREIDKPHLLEREHILDAQILIFKDHNPPSTCLIFHVEKEKIKREKKKSELFTA